MEIRSGKASAEKREEYLRAGTDKLLEELAKLRGVALTPKKSSGPVSELQALLIKWTSANNLLAESQQRIEVKDQKLKNQDEQIRSLSKQLTEAKARQENSKGEIARLCERLTQMENSANWEGKQLVSTILTWYSPTDQAVQLAGKEQLISNLQQELTRSKEQYSDRSNELEQVRSVHDTLLGDLEDRDRRLSHVGRDYAIAKSTVTSLNQILLHIDSLREQAARIPDLIHESEVKDTTIKNLHQDLEEFNTVKREIDFLWMETKNKTEQIAELHTRLQSAEESSRQLNAIQCELATARENIDRLNYADERAVAPEGELDQKNHRINQLDLEVANLEDTLEQRNDLQMEVDRFKNDYECMEKKPEAAEGEAGRAPILERKLSDQDGHVSQLIAKLAEAERVAKDVPELQAQMNQFSQTFDSLKHELDYAQKMAEEFHSTKAANTELKQAIQELQEKAAVADEATKSAKCLSEEIKQKDAQIMTLQGQLRRADVDTQQQKLIGHAVKEENQHKNPSQDTLRLREGIPTHRESADQDTNPEALENQAGGIAANGNNPRKERKRANRNANTSQANESALEDQELSIKTSRSAGSGLHLPDASAANDQGQGHVCPDQGIAQTDIIPESQPCAIDVRNDLLANQQSGKSVEQAMSSSPLSDVGELFDPSDSHQFEHSHHFKTDEPSESLDELASENDFEAAQSENLVIEQYDSQHIRYGFEQSSHGERLLSSSYGEPLLLDDQEGSVLLPTRTSGDTALEKRSYSSIQDELTSPVTQVPQKLSRKGTHTWAAVASLSKPETKSVDSLQYGRQLAKDPSPRRLRSKETGSQSKTRQSSYGPDHGTADMRASTPKIPPKEKHQPNSAIKRKVEAAVAIEETGATKKKRVKRNLSIMEVATRPRTGSQSLHSSTQSDVEQTLSRMMQSSTSTASSSRSTIVGKNAPAPSTGKAPKKPRGGSKSEECLIITISRGY